MVITGIATAVVNLGLTTILKNLVNIAAGDVSLSFSFNLILSVGFVLLEGAAAITTALTYRLSTETSTKKLRLRLCKKYYESDLLSIEKHHAGEYLTNLTTDVENVSSCIPSMIRQKKLIDTLNIVYEVREQNLVKVSNTFREQREKAPDGAKKQAPGVFSCSAGGSLRKKKNPRRKMYKSPRAVNKLTVRGERE